MKKPEITKITIEGRRAVVEFRLPLGYDGFKFANDLLDQRGKYPAGNDLVLNTGKEVTFRNVWNAIKGK